MNIFEVPLIKLSPGCRFKAMIYDKSGNEFVIVDVMTPNFLTNDDGSKGDVNDLFCWLINVVATLFPPSPTSSERTHNEKENGQAT